MRVISGSARGKKLYTLEGMDIRPTLDRVKESVFNMIAFDLPGAVVLDLFCGSGALGIEALSRGADHATFVDNNPKSLAVAQKNLTETHLADHATSVLSDSLVFLKTTTEQFDIIFIDPPYESTLYQDVLAEITSRKLLKPDGQVVVELDKMTTPAFSVDGFSSQREKYYGRVKILIMKE